MAETTLAQRLAFELLQRETSAEIEEIVFAGLTPYVERFRADEHDERLIMMVRAAYHARDTATRLRKEAADLSAALEIIDPAPPLQGEK